MAGGIICGALTTHTPRMANIENAPAFVNGLIQGSFDLGKKLRGLNPDVLVVNSTHWVSSFNWYTTCQDPHEGICVADEAPDLIPGIPYKRKGDPVFAKLLVELIAEEGLPCGLNETPHFQWDYGSLVPLLYLDPEAEIPVVLIPSCLMADYEECQQVGRLIHQAAEIAGKRVIFIASSALTHEIIRGPEQWPTQERQELDFKFIQLLCEGRIQEATSWLPEYHREAKLEMGGRNVAMLLGTLDALEETTLSGQQFGSYGQSSGSGNISIAIGPGLG